LNGNYNAQPAIVLTG
jgi:hypothetical protein